MFQNLEGNSPVGAMRGAGGCGRGASRLATAKRRLLQAAAIGALTLPSAFTSPDVASVISIDVIGLFARLPRY
jgi:hypothetical protein